MIDGSYGSHVPWLALLCSRTSGPVLELGTGINSTPLLHVMVAMQRRQLISYETDEWWMDYLKGLAGDFHKFVDVADWSKVIFPRSEVAFVDCSPAREERQDVCQRVTLIKRLKLSSIFIVAHDTEADIPPSAGAYGWAKLDGLFKYQTVLDKFRPWTTVYSDVEEFRP